MSEMIERVAKAQAGARWDQFDEEHKSAARDLARTAIEAMREPTEYMVAAVGAHPWDDPSKISVMRSELRRLENPEPYDDAWRTMIDAALTSSNSAPPPLSAPPNTPQP